MLNAWQATETTPENQISTNTHTFYMPFTPFCPHAKHKALIFSVKHPAK